MKRSLVIIFLSLLFCNYGFADIITFQCPNTQHIVDTDKETLKMKNNSGKITNLFIVRMDENNIEYRTDLSSKEYQFQYGTSGRIIKVKPERKYIARCKKINTQVTQIQEPSETTDTSSSVSTTATEVSDVKLTPTDELVYF